MSTPQPPTTTDLKDRIIRWQKYTVEQMTFALNLFLGISVGALAYGVSLVKEDHFALPPWRGRVLLIGLVALASSTLSGCLAVVSRLFDFRLTAKKIRADNKFEAGEAGVYQHKYQFFGKLTWRLFYLQLFTFLIGLFGLIVGLYSRYGYRLW